MHRLRTTRLVWLAAALALATPAAQATVHVFDLTGHASTGNYRHVGASYSAFIDLCAGHGQPAR